MVGLGCKMSNYGPSALAVKKSYELLKIFSISRIARIEGAFQAGHYLPYREKTITSHFKVVGGGSPNGRRRIGAERRLNSTITKHLRAHNPRGGEKKKKVWKDMYGCVNF